MSMDEYEMERLEELATLPFTSRGPFHGHGPRRSYIESELEEYGPERDPIGNVWVTQEGTSGREVVVSSHMDTVFGGREEGYALETADVGDREVVMGALDNGVGCWMNMYAVEEAETDHTVHHVFTVEEEYGMSGASSVADQLSDEDIDLYIALDVTYGDTRARHGDDDGAYIDSATSGRLRDWLRGIGLDDAAGIDGTTPNNEATVYAADGNSIGIGPGVYLGVHSQECYTDRSDIGAASEALHSVLGDDLEELPSPGRLDPLRHIAGRISTDIGRVWDDITSPTPPSEPLSAQDGWKDEIDPFWMD